MTDEELTIITDEYEKGNKLTERTLKARLNVLLFGVLCFVFFYSDATISQLAFLKFEVSDQLRASNMISTLMIAVLCYHFLLFVLFAKEDSNTLHAAHQITFFKNMSVSLNQIASNLGRGGNFNHDKWNEFESKYEEEKAKLKTPINLSVFRFYVIDLGVPIFAFAAGVCSYIEFKL